MNRIFLNNLLAGVLLSCGAALASELHDYASDGCSLFPNGTLQERSLWCECCFNHDLAYWRGGSKQERKKADLALRACVLERTKNNTLAGLMYRGVRAGGSPAFPTWYRWGYGWKYGRGYRPLTEEEQQQVVTKLAAYRITHPGGYCADK